MNLKIKQNWWKYLSVSLVFGLIFVGMLIPVPRLPILHETARNTFFHVPMWFTMTILLLISLIYSIRYLRTFDLKYDTMASASANVALWFGVLGLLTGMVWARFTWGEYWSNDPRQMTAAIFMLIYVAYFVLRSSMDDEEKCAKVAGVYNIFAFFAYLPLAFVIPRMMESLHPGGEGNPVFGRGDMDATMRTVFYFGAIGWILLGVWMATLVSRYENLKRKVLEINA